MSRLSVLLIVVVGAAAACTSDAPLDDRRSTTSSVARPRTDVETVGGGAASRRLLRRILANARTTRVERVSLLDPATWKRLTRPHSHPTLEFLVRASSGGDAVHGTWEAMVVAGAYTDVVGLPRRPTAVAVRYTGVSPTEFPTGSIPNPSPSSIAREPLITPEVAIRKIREVAAVHHLTIESAAISRPLGLAIAVRAVASDQERFLRDRARAVFDLTEAVGDPDRPLTDGAYFAVYNKNDRLLTPTAYATRIGVGYGSHDPKSERSP